MKSFSLAATLAFLPNVVLDVAAHSWVEQMLVIQNGTYTGNPGYMRGYTPRGPGFSDFLNQNLLPALSSNRIRIDSTDPMCRSSQTTSNYTDAYPKLNAAPGDFVAIRYLENGHVTLPQNQLGKPGSGGTVMIYATTQPKDNEKLTDVLQWNVNGTGGDGRGKLLTVQNFDDGRCYQINSSPISTQRQQQFPNKPVNAAAGSANEELWCETNVQLPSDAATNSDMTLYWAWQWNTMPNVDPGIPKGKDEWYTSCMDVNLVAAGQVKQASVKPPTKLLVQDPQQKANPNFMERAANTTLPDGGPDGGDGNLGNASGAASSGAASATSAGQQSTSTSPMFPGMTSTQGPGFIGGSGSGTPHTLTLTQIVTVTYNDKKRSMTPRTAVIADIAAPKRRNIFA